MAIVPQQRRNQAQNGESKCKLKIISNEKNSITIFPKDSKKQQKQSKIASSSDRIRRFGIANYESFLICSKSKTALTQHFQEP